MAVRQKTKVLSRHFTSLALLLLIHVLVPLALILWIWDRKDVSQIDWAIGTAIPAAFILLLFLTGIWGYVSYYLRYALLAALLVAILKSYLSARELPFWVDRGPGASFAMFISLAIVLVAVYYLVTAIRGYFFHERPLDLSFPFRKGAYAIIDGGNGVTSRVMNHHYTGAIYKKLGINNQAKYAADITKLNILATSAKGLLPRRVEKYAIFNEAIYSPCDGEVVKIVDGLPNQTPLSGNYPDNLGNQIIIKSGDILILMCHLQKDSITVKVGDRVERGQPVARVGSSGWSDQPHLHIHAMKALGDSEFGEGIPFVFDGKVPVRNRLFFRD